MDQKKKNLMLMVPMLHQGGFERVCIKTARLMQEYYNVCILIFSSKDINFDIVFSSPLQRAYETAKIITDKPVTIDNRLIERYNGKLEGCNDIDLLYKVDWNDENSIYDLERISDLYGRVKSFFDEIKEKYKGKDILVVTHAGIGIQIRLYFEGPLPEGEKPTFYRIGNGEVLIYDNN